MASYRWDAVLKTWVASSGSSDDILALQTQVAVLAAAVQALQAGATGAIPANVLGFAVGTNKTRPNAGMVLWFAASEPPGMVDGDVLFVNAVFG